MTPFDPAVAASTEAASTSIRAKSSIVGAGTYSMAEEEPTFIELRPPTQCELWETPGRARAKFSEIFDEIESYEDSSHLSRTLYKCKECGQLYFFEWMEWVDWDEGNDRQYATLFPVQTREEIEAMKQASSFMLMCYYPRLHLDGAPSWNGKDPDKSAET